MRHRDKRQILPRTKDIARVWSHRHRSRRTRRGWRRTRPLNTRIHVRFIVVTDVEYIVVTFEHAGEAAKAYIGRAPIAALCDHFYAAASLDTERRRNPRCDRCGIAEQRMHPRNLP